MLDKDSKQGGFERRLRRINLAGWSRRTEASLQILFHSFPGGRTGIGLLLLRAALGAVVLYQGAIDFTGANAVAGRWIFGSLFAASGVLLMIGLLTPCAAVLAGALEILEHAWFNPESCAPSACVSSTALAGSIACAIAILGPGALSIDARLFGLREIIIPRTRSNGPTASPSGR